MKSDQKSRRRGRSASPKKKLKRKYRNDRAKKAHDDSSSESERWSDDGSLTSDEYPSSADERRKDAKKKRFKKSKQKSRASASSSRSPSPDKSKKKKKDRKNSPMLKKKRKRSTDSKGNTSDDESSERTIAKKEKSKKKRSPSPAKAKWKRSASPTGNGNSRQSRKKQSVSPIRTKKKSSPSPQAKERRSRSRSPNNVRKKFKSPTRDRKKSLSPSPSRTKKNISPVASKRKSKSRSPSSKSRKRSPSPSFHKSEKKTNSHSKIRHESPISDHPKKRDLSPSSPCNARKNEPRPAESTSEKKKVHGPALPHPSSFKSPSPHASKSGPPTPPGPAPTPPRMKSSNGDERKVSKSSKDTKKLLESKKISDTPEADIKKKKGTDMPEMVKKRSFNPVSDGVEKAPTKKAPLTAKEIAKKVIAAKAVSPHDGEKKVVLPKPPGDEEKKVVTALPEKETEPEQKLIASKDATKESEKNVPESIKTVDSKVPSSPMEKMKPDSGSDMHKVKEEEDAACIEKKVTTATDGANVTSDNTSLKSKGTKEEGLPTIALKDQVKEEIKDEVIDTKIKTSLLVMKKKKITIAPTLNALSVKEEAADLQKREDIKKEDIKKEEIKKDGIKKEEGNNDEIKEDKKKDGTKKDPKSSTDPSSKPTKTSSPVVFRSRKKSSSPSRNRKKSRSTSPRTHKRSKSPSPRSRKRSKSPRRDRKRSRSRSRSPSRRDRRDDKSRRRSRSRSADKDSKKKKDREEKDRRNRRDDKEKDRKKKDDKDSKIKKEKSPEKDITDVEEEMKKRKERIEAWRNANKKKGEGSESGEKTEDNETKVKAEKKWSLEDDDDSEGEDQLEQKKGDERKSKKDLMDSNEVKKEEGEDEDEEDPLEAYMKSIDSQVNKLSGGGTALPTTTSGGTKTKTITVVKTVTVNKQPVQEVKPEVMEQNQDALEYSSEEEEKNDITASDFETTTKKKKELAVADHSKIYYAAFRRDFYVEVPELARMSSDEVKVLRESLGDVQVRGKNCPKPIKSWAQAGLSSKTMSVLKRCEYEKPTPIQAQALPVVMSGRDMIGIAKTGSGKTLAFVLPMLRHVLDQPALDEEDGPIAIIMTPTRELALQIYRESKKFCKPLNLTVTCIYGGSGISEQIAELKKGTEIIVCTPGRMIDMLAANNGKVTNCRRCTYLVMDEADRMFDMGFEPQVMRIIGNIRPDRQTVLFSATFPRQMEAVARKVLQKPIEIQVGGRSIVCSDVEQHALVIDEDNKFFKILELLGVYQEESSILLFVERQETADRLFKDLLKKGYPCLSLHGGMDQFDRDSTIADFKNGVSKLMVSTSVAARGLDVKNLNLVINYDCPNHYEDYVHRVGRTGRAGNKGTAFTFVTPDQGRNACDVIKAFELSKVEPPEDVVALWNSFKADMESAGKTIKVNSGFSGTKGFKFNAEEDAMVQDWKKLRKFQLGQQDSDEEAEAADDAISKIEADLEKAFSNKPKIALQPEVLEKQKVQASEQNVDKDKIKQAALAAELINKKLSSGQVVDRNTAATAHIMQGGALESLKGVGLAKQLADKVNAKLNYKAVEVEPEVEAKPVAVRYEEEIDINDFPQQARWRITSKEIIEQVREVSEAGVTVRGIYIPPNKKPDEEERRLHLYIESLSERSIQIAKAEIKRLLKDELLRSETNSYRPQQPTGRYKVL